MRTRLDREDLTVQTARLEEARAKLAVILDELAAAATAAARTARSKAKQPPPVNLDQVHAWARAVSDAEEAVDTAGYDLRTAAGGDG